jgi:hypothetical protein
MGRKAQVNIAFDLSSRVLQRQQLLEALDRMGRQQHYFREVNGRFTRDLSRLAIPDRLASGTLEELKAEYEIAATEVSPSRFLLVGQGLKNGDRVSLDEMHRINANFVLPEPNKKYLSEEADRMLRLHKAGESPLPGIYAQYWRIESVPEEGLVALGVRAPVAGERLAQIPLRRPAGLFESVSEAIRNPELGNSIGAAIGASAGLSVASSLLQSRDVEAWLKAAHYAQHVFFREQGRFARKWDELDSAVDFQFSKKSKSTENVRFHPIEIQEGGQRYRIVLEGTRGDIEGEQFILDQSGNIQQVRFTEALKQQLQSTTDLLEIFQVKPARELAPPSGIP